MKQGEIKAKKNLTLLTSISTGGGKKYEKKEQKENLLELNKQYIFTIFGSICNGYK